MFEIETKNLKISDELNRKIDMICRFACVKYEFIPGNIKSIKNTNIAYVKPHILKVKGNDYLILEECEEVFINGYNEKIRLKDLEKLIPSFKIANATIHFDESSPHLHIVGVPFKENCKTGMNRQVGKSEVFNVESLKNIQKELRKSCIKEFNKVYNLDMELKEREQGRNQDYRVNQMKDYDIFQRNYNKQQKKIQKVNSKTDAINEESKDIKEIINNLKQQPLNKNNLLLSNENKNKIVKYIEDIESNNKTIKSLTNYSVSLMDIKNDLNDNLNKIYKLSNENKEFKEELNNKDELLDIAEKKINKLELDIFSLEDKLRQWRLRFKKLVDYLRNKVCGLFDNKNQDIYKEIVADLHDNDFLTNDDYNKIQMKSVIQEKVSTKKERKKEYSLEL